MESLLKKHKKDHANHNIYNKPINKRPRLSKDQINLIKKVYTNMCSKNNSFEKLEIQIRI